MGQIKNKYLPLKIDSDILNLKHVMHNVHRLEENYFRYCTMESRFKKLIYMPVWRERGE